jgi:thimet oligopeptidase
VTEKIIDFDKNLAEENGTFACTREDLKGVSSRIIDSLEKNNDQQMIIKTDYPTMFEIFDNCEIEETRKKASRLFHNRAYPANYPLLQDIAKLQQQKAELLGFPDFAHMDIDQNMAKNPAEVRAFFEDLSSSVEKKSKIEFAQWKSYLPESVSLTEEELFKPWDVRFVKNQYKKKHHNIDEREIQEYFPLESTIRGLFQVYQNLLKIKFTYHNQPENVWHEDVTLIEVTSKKTNKTIGFIYLDLFPREGKFSHACCENIQTPVITENGSPLPTVGFVLANFPKNGVGEPALLKHDDVITFFHEFGHAMHAILGATNFSCSSGLEVLLDFAEAPSQMFEEWMWHPDVLKKVSSHYKTGNPLPQDIIDKMLAARNFDFGQFVQRQIFNSLISLNLYSKDEPKEIQAIEKSAHAQVDMPIAFDDQTHFSASFMHLTCYHSAYYGYMWSRVFSMDLFNEVKKHGLESEKASELVRGLLTPGGSVAPDKIIKDLLGRDLSMNSIKEMAKLYLIAK